MWRDAWQRLASSYPTSRWDVAINLMVTAAGRCSLTRPETRKLAAWEPAVHSVHRIARIWTRLLAIWGVIQQTVYHHPGFCLVDKIKRAVVKNMAETTAWRSYCQFITFITFYLRLTLFARWCHYFPRLIQKNKFSMKRTWFVPNLAKICSIFLKL